MDYVAVAPRNVDKYCPDGFTQHSFRKMPFIAFNRRTIWQTEFISRTFRFQPVLRPQLRGQVRTVLDGWGAASCLNFVRPMLEEGV